MFCSNCGANLNDDAKFCHKCGKPTAVNQTEIHTGGGAAVQGDVNVGRDFAGRDHVTIEGNVIVIGNASDELLAQLKNIKSVSTSLQPEDPSHQTAPQLNARASDAQSLLNYFRSVEQKGDSIQEIRAGDQNISKIELLLKQAILLRTDAEQMWFAHMQRHQDKLQAAQWQSVYTRSQIDYSDVLRDFDLNGYREKLSEAQALLKEANKIEPTNAEVLLHSAHVYAALNREDKQGVRSIAYRVTQLLNPPKSAQENFWLAQAMVMMSLTAAPPDLTILRGARDKFAQLGETIWVQYCDTQAQWIMSSAASMFQPNGVWQFNANDGSIAQVTFQPNGVCFGTTQSPIYGQFQFTGQWQYNPTTRELVTFGSSTNMINTFQFRTVTQVQGQQQPNVFYGTSNDGQFQRAVTFWRIG
jgi:hypothetical protein